MAPADGFLGWIIDASHLARSEDLPRLILEGARRFGARAANLYVVDYEQTVLLPLHENGDALPIDGSAAGRSFASIETVRNEAADGVVLWLPLLDGTERVGALEVRMPEVNDEDVERARQLAGLAAELVVTRGMYGDLVERLRRRRPMSLPAELQWGLLPPLTHTTPWGVISCVLTPCYDVGGDAFDYAVDGTTMRWAIFDAMGHGLQASLLAAVTIGAYRNARRRGATLEATYIDIDEAIVDGFGPDSFVTGILAELDLVSGALRRINAGHPQGVRIGADGSVAMLPLANRTVPFGVGGQPVVLDVQLSPGDRLLFYTDGVTEARDEEGAFFGLDRLVELITRESEIGRPAPEMLRRLASAIGAHQKGAYQDDATTMMIEWLGEQRARTLPL